MLDGLLPTTAALAYSTLLGFAVRRLVLRGLRLGRAEALACDFGVGACVVTLWMLALAALGPRFSVWSVGAIGVPLLPALLHTPAGAPAGMPAGAPERGSRQQGRTAVLEWGLMAGIALLLGVSGFLAATLPETNWDTISHWGLKAKAFWLHGTIWLQDYDAHNYYPPHVPLLTTWLYLAVGRVDEILARSTSLSYGVGLLTLVYAALLRESHSRLVAGALALLLLAGANQLLQQLVTTQADLPLTFYLTGAVIGVWRWLRAPGERAWLILAGLFAGGATWTKYEGLFLVALLVIAAGASLLLERADLRPRVPALAVFGAAATLPALAWAVYRSAHGIPVESEHITALLVPERLPAVALETARFLASGRSAGLWLATLGTWTLFARRSLEAPHRFLAVALALNLVAVVWALDVTTEDPLDQVTRAGGRLLMHAAPLAVLLLGSLLRAAQLLPERGRRVLKADLR